MARRFDDGSSQYLKITQKVVGDEPFSFVCWFNQDDDTIACRLLALSDASNDKDRVDLLTRGNVDDTIGVSYTPSGGAGSAWTTTIFTANTWHHACGVIAASNDLRVYIDGGSKGTAAPTQAVVWANIDTTSVGALVYNNTVVSHMSGAITEAAIYDCILTDTDAALFHHRRYSALKIRPQNLMAYYALRHGDNADWMGRYPILPYNTPGDIAPPPIVYPERDDPVWGLVLPRYRPRRYWVVGKVPGNPWYAYAQQ